MTVNIKKIGGSVAVLIPRSLARDLELVEGTAMDITSENGSLRLSKKIRRARRPLAELVAQIKPGNYKRRSQEFSDTIGDPAVGKEIW